MTKLEKTGLRENTIVVWTTDNGTGGKSNRLNGRVVRGAKGKTLENGVCEPFIVSCPGLVPQGVTTDALTDFTDLLPTFAELADAQLPEGHIIDGKSFAPLILGKADVERVSRRDGLKLAAERSRGTIREIIITLFLMLLLNLLKQPRAAVDVASVVSQIAGNDCGMGLTGIDPDMAVGNRSRVGGGGA